MSKHSHCQRTGFVWFCLFGMTVLMGLSSHVYAQEQDTRSDNTPDFVTGKILEDQLIRIRAFLADNQMMVLGYSAREDVVRLVLAARTDYDLSEVAKGLFISIGAHVHRLELGINAKAPLIVTRSMVGLPHYKKDAVAENIPNETKKDIALDFVEISTREAVKTRVLEDRVKVTMRVRYNKDLTYRVASYVRELAKNAPDHIGLIDVTLQDQAADIAHYSFVTKHLKKMNEKTISVGEVFASTQFTYGLKHQKREGALTLPPVFDIAFMPDVESQIAKGEFSATDLFIAAEARLAFDNGITFKARARQKITGDFDDYIAEPENVNLPVVRSDLQQYLTQKEPMLENLMVQYGVVPADNYYGQISVGYLDTMYAGARLEALYIPPYSNWSASIDMAFVKKREPNMVFALDDGTRFSGHFSLHKEFPGKGLVANMSVGRYLGGDWGITTELKKTFDNGLSLGFYRTKTTASRSLFGLGGDQMGLVLSIPFSIGTRGAPTKPMRFYTGARLRDAGQKLDRGDALFERFKVVKDWRVRLGWPSE